MIELSFPCPENSCSMPSVAGGKFCGTCSRNIVDFTAMNNEQIQRILSASSGKTCGIFSAAQVSNPSKSEVGTLFRFAFAMVFMLGMNWSTVNAQITEDGGNPAVKITPQVKGPIQVWGQITNEYGEAIQKAEIFIEGSKNTFRIKTDADGNFVLDPKFCLYEDEIFITVSARNCIPETFVLNNLRSGSYAIQVSLTQEHSKRKDPEIYLGFMGKSVVSPAQ